MKEWSCVIMALISALSVNAKDDLNVLFVGNSYTAQAKGAINSLLKDSPHKESKFEYVTAGGCTLERHLKNPEVIRKIKEGKWDYVVLQDQSQTPGLPGLKDGFLDASASFCKLIKESGAKPVFYMTWGRRDGDKSNQEFYPDYATMQKKLADAYLEAAKANDAMVAPVGLVWSSVRDGLKDDYGALYRNDGSHPSAQGAFLVACVFFKTLFNSDLDFVKPETDREKLIKEAVLKHLSAR